MTQSARQPTWIICQEAHRNRWTREIHRQHYSMCAPALLHRLGQFSLSVYHWFAFTCTSINTTGGSGSSFRWQEKFKWESDKSWPDLLYLSSSVHLFKPTKQVTCVSAACQCNFIESLTTELCQHPNEACLPWTWTAHDTARPPVLSALCHTLQILHLMMQQTQLCLLPAHHWLNIVSCSFASLPSWYGCFANM